MANLNFDPIIGEEVHTPGHYGGPFRIVAVHPTTHSGLGTVDLKQTGNDHLVSGVPWTMLLFDETRPIRRAIEWLKENPVVPYPDYVIDYQVEAKDDHQGNPAFYVRFIVEPDDQPSREKIKELNRFLDSVTTLLLSLGLDRWPYVHVAEKRSLVDVAG